MQRLAQALVRHGHQVTVIHDINSFEWLAGRRLPDQPAMQDGVEVIGLRSALGVLSPFLTHQAGSPVVQRRTLERLLKERVPDVVLFGNVSLLGGPGLLELGGDALKVYLAHEHWLVCPTHLLWRFNQEPCHERSCLRCVLSYKRPPQLWRYTGRLERRLPGIDLFLARSEFSRRKHREFGFTQPMEVLPFFLPDSYPTQSSHGSTERPHARPYFLSVGRLVRMKGFDTVIPAFQSYPDADWLLAGDGDEMPHLRELAAAVPNVKLLGPVENRDLSRYYEHAIAAIVPSTGYETLGIVLIEAFRNRTPVIARRIGPFPEIVEKAGGGVLYATNEQLLEAMASMQRDSGLRGQMGMSGYAASHQEWSEPSVIHRLLTLIDGVRARRSAR
jgi:glycosyltransferase involved in cell wall biosynthesis